MTYNILIKLCIEVLTYFMFEVLDDDRTLEEVKRKIEWRVKDWYVRRGKTVNIKYLNVYFKHDVLNICLILEDKKYQLDFILSPYSISIYDETHYQFDLEASAYFESNNIPYNVVVFDNITSPISSAPLLATMMEDEHIKCVTIEKSSLVGKDKLVYPLMKWAFNK